jgi:hypothetical protein
MKLTKPLLKQMIQEQVEVLKEEFDIEDLVDGHDLEHSKDGIPFFLSLVREFPGAFMEQREQELAEEMRQAVANILRSVDRR